MGAVLGLIHMHDIGLSYCVIWLGLGGNNTKQKKNDANRTKRSSVIFFEVSVRKFLDDKGWVTKVKSVQEGAICPW
jgi:hypothetical protein